MEAKSLYIECSKKFQSNKLYSEFTPFKIKNVDYYKNTIKTI